MKTTGVSRRIDDLGRIVIPKEIRKDLKIRSGELLEIMVDDENIILSKHSTMIGITETANLCVDSVNDALNINMIITDRDKVIAASSQVRKKYLDKDLTIEISERIIKHQAVVEKEPTILKITDDDVEETGYVAFPIIVDGDVAGSVIVFGQNGRLSEVEEKIAEIISKFLSRNII